MAPRRLAAVEMQPKNFAFSAENLEWAKVELTKYPYGRQESAILALLWRAQAQCGGWLPEAAIRYVADFLGMAHIRALEVATFYTMFNLEPVGRYHVQLCGTTPCMLRGAEDLKQVLREKVGEEHHVGADPVPGDADGDGGGDGHHGDHHPGHRHTAVGRPPDRAGAQTAACSPACSSACSSASSMIVGGVVTLRPSSFTSAISNTSSSVLTG